MSGGVLKILAATLLLALAAAPACRTASKESAETTARRQAGAASSSQPQAAAPPTDQAQRAEASPENLRRVMAAVKHLHEPLGPIRDGDWLTTSEEPGQTFDEYLHADPIRVAGTRRVLYVQPLGGFTPAQRRVVELTADFMSRFFSLPVSVRPDQPLDGVPDAARRVHPAWGDHQIQAGHITMNILRPALPEDAVAMIGFTAADLFPDESMNFVFGQASLSDRVGVWSLYRLGSPEADERSFRLTLLRTMKIAAHETGHMFSVRHCTKYECVMCGINHLNEMDRRPLDACPECTAKICWATNADPRGRYARLAEFCDAQGFRHEARTFEAALKALAKT